MNKKNLIPLIAAVALGLIALVVARKALDKTGSVDGKIPLMGVVIANRDIPPGRELTLEDLSVSRMPADVMPPSSFRTAQELVTRTTTSPLVKGQALVEPVLAPTGTRGGLQAMIPSGQRAMTVEVNEFTGLAGMIAPGCHVDVIAVLRDEKTSLPATRTILQNIAVTAVGRNINPAPPADGAPPAAPSNNVTMLVTPRQAQVLQLASQSGRPWLVLRNPRDIKENDAEMTTLAQLRNDPGISGEAGGAWLQTVGNPTTGPSASADPFAGPIATARVVQVIRAGVESTVTFPGSGVPRSQPPMPATRPTLPRPSTPDDGRSITGTAGDTRKITD